MLLWKLINKIAATIISIRRQTITTEVPQQQQQIKRNNKNKKMVSATTIACNFNKRWRQLKIGSQNEEQDGGNEGAREPGVGRKAANAFESCAVR